MCIYINVYAHTFSAYISTHIALQTHQPPISRCFPPSVRSVDLQSQCCIEILPQLSCLEWLCTRSSAEPRVLRCERPVPAEQRHEPADGAGTETTRVPPRDCPGPGSSCLNTDTCAHRGLHPAAFYTLVPPSQSGSRFNSSIFKTKTFAVSFREAICSGNLLSSPSQPHPLTVMFSNVS